MELRRFEQVLSSPATSAGHSNTYDPVKISLEPLAIVGEKGERFFQIEARCETPEPGLWVLNSLGVYDDQGREYVPQSLGKKTTRHAGGAHR